MKSLLLAGVGGQGIILMSKILLAGLMEEGHDVKMSEIHGMSQRGGSVTTQVRYGEKIYSPSVGFGEADFIVAFEKAEALRALPYLKCDGALITDDYEIYPMTVASGDMPYPENILTELEKQVEHFKVIPAFNIAKEYGNVKAQNIVMLGALVKLMDFTKADWPKIIANNVPKASLELNQRAFEYGYNIN